MSYCAWSDGEIVNLFNEVERAKVEKRAISSAFKNYASMTGRQANSVRNYYYIELNHLYEDADKANRLSISLANHQKNEIKIFSNEENRKLLEIENLVKKGYSVRSACFKITNGNVKDMLRLQNKYRSGSVEKRGDISNITFMPTQKKMQLSEKEIQSLFMGLVRLVKSTAIEEVNENLKKESEFAGSTLRRTLMLLTGKEKELCNLKKDFELIRNENDKLLKEIEDLKCDKADAFSGKLKKLKDYDFNKSKKVELKSE